MMKRQGVPRLGGQDDSPLPPPHSQPVITQQAGASNMHTLAQSAQPQLIGATTMLSVGAGGYARSAAGAPPPAGAPRGPPPPVNYLKPPGAVQYAAPKQPAQPTMHTQPRHKAYLTASPLNGPQQSPGSPSQGALVAVSALGAPPSGPQFQRLKVEDALSYLDQVKYKFNTQPQVYNDFLDIMKEFKSQTIDTPGVITRVSNLFQGHPELIVGFNTFLPPGYKIEVKSNGQVSVSMPSPTSLAVVGALGGVGGTVGGVGGGAVGGGPVGGGNAGPVSGQVLLGVHHAPPQPQLVHLLPVPVVQPTVSVSGAIVHNLSVSAAPPQSNTLHHISQAHQQIEAAHHSQGGVQSAGPHAPAAPPGQPVEFNHAIEYVNKIKSRFSRQPDKYKRFLEILHAYQRGHREVKDTLCKQQTEQEVYAQVAKLFENQDDLLLEFGQFLPDAKAAPTKHHAIHQRLSLEGDSEVSRYPHPHPHPAPAQPASPPPHHHAQLSKHSGGAPAGVSAPPTHHHLKRSPSFSASSQTNSGAPPAKKPRVSVLTGAAVRDVSYAEAAKYGTLQEYNYFDRVRHALKNTDVYDNFLKCLMLFVNEVISSSELIQMTSTFFCRHPELQRWLHDFVGPMSPPHTPTNVTHPTGGYNCHPAATVAGGAGGAAAAGGEAWPRARYEPLGAPAVAHRLDRPQGDAAMDVDLSSCRRLGTSYCALPRGSEDAASRRCSGRTPLCREVLNDTWVSFPTWSEDSTFVTGRKTQYEEYMYRCEDERFELDVVIETNAATIRVLEGVQKRLSRMSAEDVAKFRLDDCLGGTSPTVHQRALRRIYGDKVAVDIIAGLKKNPVVAVPVVLRRLKAKEEEWREAQKGFNKQWREQNEKYYLKSLDHQGINFKQNDLKALRSKSLFNEVESAYADRKPGPHLVVDYNMTNRAEAIKIVRDAAELLIHHARRQTAIQKAEKRRIKQLVRHFMPDLFGHPRLPLSDDERDEDDKEDPTSPDSPIAEDAADTDGNEIKQEKQEQSSESDNASDKSSRNNHKNNKENTPKNNNNTENNIKDSSAPNLKRSSSNSNDEPQSQMKYEIKADMDVDDDCSDAPANESRFVCSMSWYLFLRLHGVLCQRLGALRRAAPVGAPAPAPGAPAAAQALRLRPGGGGGTGGYPALLELVRSALDGNTDAAAYEDAARELMGIRAYPAYTLDKVVTYAVRQLQHCVSESWSWRAAELAARGGMRAAGGSYLRRARRFLRQEHTAFLVRVYGGNECRVTFSLLEGVNDGSSPHDNSRLSPTNQSRTASSNGSGVSRAAAWSVYAERYTRPTLGGGGGGGGGNKPVFLRRNARRCGGGAVSGAASAPGPAAPSARAPHARRKPPRLHDTSECTLTPAIRLIAARPHRLYRAGALRAAREAHGRLHAARRERFSTWLRRRTS